MSKKILSLSGLKGSGKDAVFKGLVKRFPDKIIERIAWADPVKEEIHDLFGIPMDLLHADQETKNTTRSGIKGVDMVNMVNKLNSYMPTGSEVKLARTLPLFVEFTVREVLQYWGTEYRRDREPDYWVNKGHHKIAESNADLIVITDTRFVNEIKYVHHNGGVTIWLDRKKPLVTDEHISELDLTDYTMWTVPSFGKQSLEETLEDTCEILKKSKLEFE